MTYESVSDKPLWTCC